MALEILTEKLRLQEILMTQTHTNKKTAQLKFLSRARFCSASLGGENQSQSKSNEESKSEKVGALKKRV